MKAYLAIVTTIVFFSTIEVVVKLIGPEVDPMLIAASRFLIAGLIMLGISPRAVKSFDRRDVIRLGALGIIGVAICFGAYHVSLRTIDASTGAVIFSINPLFSALTAHVLLKEPLGRRMFAGLVLGFAGVYILSFGFTLISLQAISGPLLMLISAVAFGVYIASSKSYVKKYGPLVVTGFMFCTGSLFLLPLIRDFSISQPLHTGLWLGYLILFATGLAYLFYFYGLARVPVVTGTSIFFIKPVIASLLAVIVLNETLQAHFYIGLVVIISALLLVVVPRKAELESR
ncbi:MAG: DMT family transporter [Chitinispirillaceae bacterium]